MWICQRQVDYSSIFDIPVNLKSFIPLFLTLLLIISVPEFYIEIKFSTLQILIRIYLILQFCCCHVDVCIIVLCLCLMMMLVIWLVFCFFFNYLFYRSFFMIWRLDSPSGAHLSKSAIENDMIYRLSGTSRYLPFDGRYGYQRSIWSILETLPSF